VEARLAITAAGVLARTLDPWLDGEIDAEPQPSEGATVTRPLRRADGELDPRQPAAILERRVRAYQPWPGTFFEADGQRVVVLGAAVAPSDADDEPGGLVADAAGLAIATTDGRLVLREVQPAAGRPMSGEAFLRGRPWILGRSIVTPVVPRAGAGEPA
jgi:methionyl-tRNA formyltransferase